MAYVELYPVEEPVTWSAYDSSYPYSSSSAYGRSYHSNAIMLHVSMCCEKCVQKVRKALKNVDDIDSVDIDMPRQRVIVRGYVSADRVLRKVQKVTKSATFWDSSHDYASYSTGAYNYHRPSSSGSYDSYYYNQSPSYDYSYSSYPSSYDYDYPGHHYRSYDAYRYR